jgi:hypothetical protein
MKKIVTVMNQLISQGRKLLVLTQSNDLARAFLYDNPGKWTAKINEKYWPASLQISERIGKIGFVEGDEPANIGFNAMASDVIFSKRPMGTVHPSYAIIQTHFRSPVVEISDYACHTTNVKGSVFFPEDPEKWRYVLDVLGDTETVIMDKIKYIRAERAVIARSNVYPIDLCGLHDVDRIMVSKNMLWEQMPTIHQCQSVMEAMRFLDDTMKGSAVDADWVSRHAIVNAFAIPKVLELLRFMKCVQEVVMDSSTVVIQKKPPFPNDIEYGSIPEGTFQMCEIRKLLGPDALKLLKRYEGNGIVFGYNDKKHKFYRPLIGVTREEYHNATETLSTMSHQWNQIAGNAKWLNNYVHESVRRLYQSHDVYMVSDDMQEIERVGDVVNVKL